ncbi:MAG: extracellular solute-binding protein [Mycoplasmatales bacterium]
MKKIFGILLVAILVLAGCGSGDASKVITWQLVGTPPADEKIVEDSINSYLKDELGKDYTIDFIYFDYGTYNDKLKLKIQSGEEMDIFFTPEWALDYTKNSKEGRNVDLTDALNSSLADTHAAVDPSFWAGAEVDGKVYAVPTNKEIGVQTYGVFNQVYVDKYGIDTEKINTEEEFVAVLRDIKLKEPNLKPFLADIGTHWALTLGLDCAPGTQDQICFDPQEPEAGYRFVYDIPRYNEFMQRLNGYIKEGIVVTNTLELWDNKTTDFFCSLQQGYPGAETSWEKDWEKQLSSHPIQDPLVTTNSTRGSLNAISSTSKNIDESIDFLNLANTDPKIRNTMAYGVEGTHYTLEDDQVKISKTGVDNYSVGIYEQGNYMIMKTTVGTDKNSWDLIKKANEEKINSPALGFVPDYKEFSDVITNFASLMEQKHRTSLIMGQSDNLQADLDAFRKDADQIKLDSLLSSINEQFKNWK